MTENEAKEYLLNRYLVVGSPVNPPKEECEKHNAVLDMAIQALEKQIPKKPIRKPNADMTYEEVTCPSCGRYVSQYRNEYYCECGQKLDWDD